MIKRIVFILIVCIAVGQLTICPAEENYVIAQPGDQGGDVELVLSKCAELGFIKNLPDGTDLYSEEYETEIRAMEKALGFQEDGIIHLDEFEELEKAIGKGSENSTVQEMLERLYDLGYIQTALPEKHSLYDAKYVNAVKNAEKKLGLHADGILLRSEIETIRKQKFDRLTEVKNVRASSKNGKVTVSWSPVKGAVRYSIYRGGGFYKTVTGKTSFTDENVEMGYSYSYSVKAESYRRATSVSNSVSVEVEIVYTRSNLKEVKEYVRTKQSAYITLSNLKYEYGRTSGKNYIIGVSQTINGLTYNAVLRLEDFRDWTGSVPSIDRKAISKITSCKGYISLPDSTGSIPTIILTNISYSY